MSTVKQLLVDAVQADEVFLAHAIYIAIQDGVLQLEDPQSALDYDKIDLRKAKKSADENLLAMNLIKLYAMPLEPGAFAFILAANQKDAFSEFCRQYNRQPVKVLDMSLQMDRSLYFDERDKHMSFRQIKSQVQTFPYFVCEFQKSPINYQKAN